MQTRWLAIPAILIALYGGALAYEQTAAPATCCGLTWPNPDPVQTERLTSLRDPHGLDLVLQKKAALTVLAARPGEPTAWMRLANADIILGGRLTPAAQTALDNSYLAAPYAGAWAPWRAVLTLNVWPALRTATREQAVQEIRLAMMAQGEPDAMRAAAGAVRDPAGKQAAVLLGMTSR